MMRSKITIVALLCGLIMGAGLLQAQTHYPAGVEGIKGPSLPPPGVYFRDYNYIYFADKLEVKGAPPEFDVLAYVQAPRFIYITNQKVLGGYYGVDAIIPFAYQNLDMTGFNGSKVGLADIFTEQTLSWHWKQADASFGYGFWLPTGDFKTTDPVSPGKGFLTQMLTAGVTIYPDKAKTWSIAALNRYEFNSKRDDGMTPGQYWTLEWGIGKSLSKTVEIGATGYVQAQTTSASGPGASNEKDHVASAGPEITFVCPSLKLNTSIRYMREFAAHNRTEGNTINITFTRRF
jgi:hypothetical protein